MLSQCFYTTRAQNLPLYHLTIILLQEIIHRATLISASLGSRYILELHKSFLPNTPVCGPDISNSIFFSHYDHQNPSLAHPKQELKFRSNNTQPTGIPANRPGFPWIVQEVDYLSRGPGIRSIRPGIRSILPGILTFWLAIMVQSCMPSSNLLYNLLYNLLFTHLLSKAAKYIISVYSLDKYCGYCFSKKQQ